MVLAQSLFGFIHCWAFYIVDYNRQLTFIGHFCTMLTRHVFASGINSATGRELLFGVNLGKLNTSWKIPFFWGGGARTVHWKRHSWNTTLDISIDIILEVPTFEPWAARWETPTLPLCYSDPSLISPTQEYPKPNIFRLNPALDFFCCRSGTDGGGCFCF